MQAQYESHQDSEDQLRQGGALSSLRKLVVGGSAYGNEPAQCTRYTVEQAAALPAEVKTSPTYMERMTMREDMMKARLASLEAVKPSLQALYAALTPEQKAIFDKPMRMGMGTGSMHRPHPNRG